MITAFFLLFVTDSWLVRTVVVAAYVAVRIPLERKRNRLNRRLEMEQRHRRHPPGSDSLVDYFRAKDTRFQREKGMLEACFTFVGSALAGAMPSFVP